MVEQEPTGRIVVRQCRPEMGEDRGQSLALSLTLFHGKFFEQSALTLPNSSTAVAGACGPDGLGSVHAALTEATGQEETFPVPPPPSATSSLQTFASGGP